MGFVFQQAEGIIYHALLSILSAARCFAVDSKCGQMMNDSEQSVNFIIEFDWDLDQWNTSMG